MSNSSEVEAARGNGEQITLLRQLVANSTHLVRSDLLKHILDGRLDRDLDLEAGYPASISTDQYRAMYEREGIAARVVACMPEETWQLDPEIYETEDPNETEFEAAWKDLVYRHNIYHYLHRVDELSGIGEFGLLLLGLDDGEDLSKRVDGVNEDGTMGEGGGGERKLIFLRVYDQSVVTIKARQTDMKSPRYSLPTLYTVELQSMETVAGGTVSSKTTDIH